MGETHRVAGPLQGQRRCEASARPLCDPARGGSGVRAMNTVKLVCDREYKAKHTYLLRSSRPPCSVVCAAFLPWHLLVLCTTSHVPWCNRDLLSCDFCSMVLHTHFRVGPSMARCHTCPCHTARSEHSESGAWSGALGAKRRMNVALD